MPDFVMPFPERVVERGRGCYNCIAFESGDLCRKRYFEARLADLAASANPGVRRLASGLRSDSLLRAVRLAGTGTRSDLASEAVLAEAMVAKEADRFSYFDKLVAAGKIGLCLIGKAPSDFVENVYLCEGWTGRQGSSLATSGKPLDKLPDELRDILDGSDASVPKP